MLPNEIEESRTVDEVDRGGRGSNGAPRLSSKARQSDVNPLQGAHVPPNAFGKGQYLGRVYLALREHGGCVDEKPTPGEGLGITSGDVYDPASPHRGEHGLQSESSE